MFVNGCHVVYYMNYPKAKGMLYNVYKDGKYQETVEVDTLESIREYIKELGDGYSFIATECDDD